jgi:hypothetical protein
MRLWFWAFGAALFAIRFTPTSLSILTPVNSFFRIRKDS